MDRIFTCLGFLGILWLQVNARIATECHKFEQRSQECWNKHKDVPNCIGIDPLIACNDDSVARMPSDCTMKIKTGSQHILAISQLLHRVVCARRSDILEEFISKPQCWDRARHCLKNLPTSFEEIVYRNYPPLVDLDSGEVLPLAAREKIVATECYEEGEDMHLCYKQATDCEYLEEFVNLILDNSLCKSYRYEDCPKCAHNDKMLNRLILKDEPNTGATKSAKHFSLIFVFIFIYFNLI